MKPPNFEEAVRQSKALIENAPDMHTPAAVEAMLAASAGVRMLRREPAQLVELAATDPNYFQALQHGLASVLDRGEEIPLEARAWLAQFLRGEIAPPKKPAGRGQSVELHLLIHTAVSFLVLGGMTATRNDASPPTSACDAVAEAMAELMLEPATFAGVKRVWFVMQKQFQKGPTPT